MKLILTEVVDGLGEPGDVVDVKDGYGRNYLLPRKLAIVWTKGGEKQVADVRRARRTRRIRDLDHAREVKTQLESLTVRLSARAGDTGKLFGSVTSADVADAVVGAGGPAIDRHSVRLPGTVRTVGTYSVEVDLHPDVAARVDIEVVPA